MIPYIEHGGYKRALACLPPDRLAGSALPRFVDKADYILPRSQWQEMSHRYLSIPTNDQKDDNSCVGQATSLGIQYCLKKYFGNSVLLSPYFIYALINKGQDRGAKLGDALEVSTVYGTCERTILPERVIYNDDITETAYTNAAQYIVTAAYKCESFDEICTALSTGFFVVFAIYVGRNFTELDNHSVAPLPNAGGGRHALLGIGLKKHTDNNSWLIDAHNSWGEGFGNNGFVYIREHHFDFGELDAFAIQFVNFAGSNEIPVAKNKEINHGRRENGFTG